MLKSVFPLDQFSNLADATAVELVSMFNAMPRRGRDCFLIQVPLLHEAPECGLEVIDHPVDLVPQNPESGNSLDGVFSLRVVEQVLKDLFFELGLLLRHRGRWHVESRLCNPRATFCRSRRTKNVALSEIGIHLAVCRAPLL